MYDNLMRFIRFQMAGLFGFIATFLGASLFMVERDYTFTESVVFGAGSGVGYRLATKRCTVRDVPSKPIAATSRCNTVAGKRIGELPSTDRRPVGCLRGALLRCIGCGARPTMG